MSQMSEITGFLIPMGSIAATWVLLATILASIGFSFQRLLGLRRISADRILTSFWTGYAAVILFLHLWHFAFPIQWPTIAVIFILGGIGLVWNSRQLAGWLSATWTRRKALVILSVVVALWAANQAAGPAKLYDTSLYHLTAVRWATKYPIVPGLGNLHDRLAYNSSSLLFAAMLEVGPWYRRASHLNNGLLWVPLMLQGILGAFRLFCSSSKGKAAGVFDTMLLLPAFVMKPWIPSLSTDLPAAVLTLVAASQLLKFLLDVEPDQRARNYNVVFICTTLAVAVCAKATSMVFSLTGGLLALVVYLVRASRAGHRLVPTTALAIALPGALLTSWVARNVTLGGYLVYPSPLAINVSWRIPAEKASRNAADIYNWGKGLGERGISDAQGWAWLKPWMTSRRTRKWILYPLALAAAMLLARIFTKARNKQSSQDGAEAWLLLLPTIAALIFWLWTGPLPRYGFQFCWVFLGAAASMVFIRRRWTASPGMRAILLTSCVFFVPFVGQWRANPLLPVRPGPDHGFHRPPRFPLKTYTTKSGLKLFIPVEGDRCGDAPLPCAPGPRPNLSLRKPGDLACGFIESPNGKQERKSN